MEALETGMMNWSEQWTACETDERHFTSNLI